jgi:hypothetical protein
MAGLKDVAEKTIAKWSLLHLPDAISLFKTGSNQIIRDPQENDRR